MRVRLVPPLFLVLLLLMALVAVPIPGRAQIPPWEIEKLPSTPAPPFSLPDLQGKQITSTAFQGRVLLVNFWATWCAPCRNEMAALDRLQRKYQEQGLTVIGISIDQGMVIDCESSGNGSGILMGQRSLVRGCVCTLNNNSGIAATFNAHRIESNTCIENDTGITVSDTNGRSVITGNVCIDSRVTAFNIATGNVCFVVAAATAGAINGNSGGVSPGTTNPWANLALP